MLLWIWPKLHFFWMGNSKSGGIFCFSPHRFLFSHFRFGPYKIREAKTPFLCLELSLSSCFFLLLARSSALENWQGSTAKITWMTSLLLPYLSKPGPLLRKYRMKKWEHECVCLCVRVCGCVHVNFSKLFICLLWAGAHNIQGERQGSAFL